MGFFRNNSNVDALRRTILNFYSASDICCAKKCLIQSFHGYLDSCSLTADRRNSSARPAHEAEVEYMCGIFDLLDSLNVLNIHIFAAVNLANIPKFGPEELNMAAVVDRQVRVESTIKDLSATVNEMMSSRDCIPADRIDVANQISSINSAMYNLNQQFTQTRVLIS